MTYRILIQARMSSTRFPGKMLAPFRGRPLIAQVLERFRELDLYSRVVLLTSVDSTDDPFADFVADRGVLRPAQSLAVAQRDLRRSRLGKRENGGRSPRRPARIGGRCGPAGILWSSREDGAGLTRQLGIAVVGLGIGEQHARMYATLPSCQVKLLVDLDRSRAENLARAFPGSDAASDLDDALDR